MNRISEFRKLANLTQQEIAGKLNMTQGAFGHYESGRNRVTVPVAYKIVQILNEHGAACSFNDVFPPAEH